MKSVSTHQKVNGGSHQVWRKPDHCTRYTNFFDFQSLTSVQNFYVSLPLTTTASQTTYPMYQMRKRTKNMMSARQQQQHWLVARLQMLSIGYVDWLFRTIAWILKFKIRWLSKHRNLQYDNKTSDQLSTNDVQHTVFSLCKLAQVETFNSMPSKIISDNNLISKIPFFSNDGLLRVGGRLKNASILRRSTKSSCHRNIFCPNWLSNTTKWQIFTLAENTHSRW